MGWIPHGFREVRRKRGKEESTLSGASKLAKILWVYENSDVMVVDG